MGTNCQKLLASPTLKNDLFRVLCGGGEIYSIVTSAKIKIVYLDGYLRCCIAPLSTWYDDLYTYRDFYCGTGEDSCNTAPDPSLAHIRMNRSVVLAGFLSMVKTSDAVCCKEEV